jgi:hypothetical protein
MNINDDWKIVEQPMNYVLMNRRKTLRPKAKTTFKWYDEGFYGSELSALEAFVRKAADGADEIEQILLLVEERIKSVKEFCK